MCIIPYRVRLYLLSKCYTCIHDTHRVPKDEREEVRHDPDICPLRAQTRSSHSLSLGSSLKTRNNNTIIRFLVYEALIDTYCKGLCTLITRL